MYIYLNFILKNSKCLNFSKTKNYHFIFLIFFTLSSCAKEGFFKTGDARKNPPDPRRELRKI